MQSHLSFLNHILTHPKLIVISWLVFLFSLERFSKKFFVPSKINDDGIIRWYKNFIFGFINRFLLPFATLPIAIFATQHLLIYRSGFFTGFSGLCVDILILDFISYLFHILSHKVPFLWRFHEIHHLDPAFDTTTGLRIHFGELFFADIFRAIPIIILGISLKAVVIFELILIIEGLFHHSNIVIPEKVTRFLNLFTVTPDMHVVHHHAYQLDTDSNYGFIFNVWDKLFKTMNTNTRTEKWRIGLEYSRDISVFELLISPFMIKNLKIRAKEKGNNTFYSGKKNYA